MPARYTRPPAPVGDLLTDLLGGAGEPPRNALRLALHGQNAPLSAQYVHHLVHVLPRQVAQHPGSAAFRAAMREVWAAQPVYLEATRADVANGAQFLAAHDLLPEWVYLPRPGGGR
jgi:hypothetical protein